LKSYVLYSYGKQSGIVLGTYSDLDVAKSEAVGAGIWEERSFGTNSASDGKANHVATHYAPNNTGKYYIYEYEVGEAATPVSSNAPKLYAVLGEYDSVEDLTYGNIYASLESAQAQVEKIEGGQQGDWYHPKDSNVWYLYIGSTDAQGPEDAFSMTRVVTFEVQP
jgi:hypothetical protein